MGWSAGSWIVWDEVGMLLGWPAGYWIVGAKVGLLQCWFAGFGRGTLLQNEQGRKRVGEGFARGRSNA